MHRDSNPGQDTVENFDGVLARVVLEEDPVSGYGGYVTRSLGALAAEFVVPLAQVREFWDTILRTLDDKSIRARSDADARTMGAWFADQGHTLTDALQVVLGLRRMAIESVHMQSLTEGRAAGYAIAGIDRVSLAMNEFTIEFNTGYFAVELANRARTRSQHNTFVWNVLAGTARNSDGFFRSGAYGLDTAALHRAFRAHPATTQELVALEAYFDLNREGGMGYGLSTVIDGDLCGLVAELPNEVPPILIGVSLPVPIMEMPNAFRRATRAYYVARRAGLGGVQSLEDLGILVSVVADEDVAQVLDKTYVQPLRIMGGQGETLLETVRCYVDNDCQLDKTARELGIHVNTVRYRLARFEDQFAVKLDETSSLAELWWMFHLPSA